MEKTRLGLSVSVASALCFLLCLFGGYTPALLFAGYVLLREENSGLKKTAVASVLIMVAFSAVNMIIGLLPDIINVLESLVVIFGGYLGIHFVDSLANFLYNVLTLARIVVFAGLAYMAYKGKQVKLSFIDKLFD